MLLRMLKKDLLRKKAMNIVLFLLIVLCTAIMASSVSNLFATNAALDNFARESNVADQYLFTSHGGADEQSIDSWLASTETVSSFRKQVFLVIAQEQVHFGNRELISNSGSIALAQVPQGGDYVFSGDTRITQLDEGSIALSYNLARGNDVQLGDRVKITSGETTRTLTVAYLMKDMLYGSDFMGFNRAIISAGDYQSLAQGSLTQGSLAQGSPAETVSFALHSDNLAQMMREKNALSYNSIFEFDSSSIQSTFAMEMITLAFLIIVAVCLILVALVLLHFAIAFTIQEDYREIGIMKGIGVGDGAIKRLYVAKYLCLSLLAVLVGLGLSFPLSAVMLSSLANTVVMGTAGEGGEVRVACALLVVLLTVCFAWIGTRRVRKLTAIQAIRSGSLGERYRRKGVVRLAASRHLPVPLFMAINDILSGMRNYVSLAIALILGILIVVLPANAANTFKSDAGNEYFGLGGVDVVIEAEQEHDYLQPGGYALMLEDLARLEQDFETEGIFLDLSYRYAYTTKVYTDNPADALTISGHCSTPGDDVPLAGLEGSPPVQSNEIAMTRILMDELGVVLGDTVHVVMGATDRPYVITGSSETLMQMGRLFNFANGAALQDETIAPISQLMTSCMGRFENRTDIPAQRAALKARYPDLVFSTPGEYVLSLVGDIQGAISDMKNLFLLLAVAVNALVVVLLAKTLLARDKGEIALLKGLGMRTGALMCWQIARMLLVAVCALLVGLVLMIPLNPVMVRFTFGMMGAPNIPAVIIWPEMCVLYPAILIAGTLLAVTLSVLSIRRISKDDFEAIE
ncbi:MAG: ABC transporter permease [Coriobacteriales bacterium]|nr:ABC transporter permease [Coriobacteriales bacterium]